MQVQQHQGKELTYVTLEPDGYSPEAGYPLVVLLHGFGSHMGDMAGLCGAIDPDGYVYALPNAPLRMEMGGGRVGYAWASLSETDDGTVRLAEGKLSGFIDEVMARYLVEPGRGVVGGFSQGGMMALLMGLKRPEAFRGVAALSSKAPSGEGLSLQRPARPDQPIFITHGTQDEMIPIEEARRLVRILEEAGYAPEYREYEMAHQITEEVVVDLSRWLSGVLGVRG